MATKIHKFTGKAHWAKLKVPDEAFGDVRWTISVELDEDGLKEFEDSGLRLKLKDMGDGKGVQFRRPVKKLIKDEMVEFSAPKVYKDGEAFEDLIGNGSNVEVQVAVYDSAMGKGHRLETVTVTDLIEYNPDAKIAIEQKADGDAPANEEKAPW